MGILSRLPVASFVRIVPAPIISTARCLVGLRARNYSQFVSFVRGKFGLEIGGASGRFRDTGLLPLYRHALRIDNVVYAAKTGYPDDPATDLYPYHPRKPEGKNYFLDATELKTIPNRAYDFILSSHSLEHIANPVKALKEWQRVTKPGSAIVVILPHYRYTIDHRRPLTTVEHMLEDYQMNTPETDLTHLEESCRCYDITRHPGRPPLEQVKEGLKRNYELRVLHHHTFDEVNSRQLLEASGLRVLSVQFMRPFHIVLLGLVP